MPHVRDPLYWTNRDMYRDYKLDNQCTKVIQLGHDTHHLHNTLVESTSGLLKCQQHLSTTNIQREKLKPNIVPLGAKTKPMLDVDLDSRTLI